MNQNKWKLVTIVAVAILLVVIAYLTTFIDNKKNNYSVVYLSSGEVYIGKLTIFPSFQLKDAYIFQVVKDANDQNKNNFSLNPLSDALWAPKKLFLNRDQILFYGPLMETSKIVETLNKQK